MSNKNQEKEKPVKFNIEEHITQLRYSDGFSWRLLGINLLIDFDFQYELSLETFESSMEIKTGILPNQICEKLKMLIEVDLDTIEPDYFIHAGASDYSSYHLTINQYGRRYDCSVGLSFETHKNFTDLENELFETLDLFDQWLVKITGYDLNSDHKTE